MLLTLVPREARFAVRLPLRMSREGATPFQVALPKAFHDRLRVEVMGSLNQALIALARQALAWLDAKQSTLRIVVDEDPLAAREQRDFTDRDRREAWDWPHKMFREVSREGAVVASLDGRPSRSGVVFVQIGLPADLQTRLHEHGVGAVGQLLVYLARYALARLQASGLSLHVNQPASTSEHPSPLTDQATRIHRFDSCRVGDLMRFFETLPADVPVMDGRDRSSLDSNALTFLEKREQGEVVEIVLLPR